MLSVKAVYFSLQNSPERSYKTVFVLSKPASFVKYYKAAGYRSIVSPIALLQGQLPIGYLLSGHASGRFYAQKAILTLTYPFG